MGPHKINASDTNKKLKCLESLKNIKKKETIEKRIRHSVLVNLKNKGNEKYSGTLNCNTPTSITKYALSEPLKCNKKYGETSANSKVNSNYADVSFEEIERKIFEQPKERGRSIRERTLHKSKQNETVTPKSNKTDKNINLPQSRNSHHKRKEIYLANSSKSVEKSVTEKFSSKHQKYGDKLTIDKTLNKEVNHKMNKKKIIEKSSSEKTDTKFKQAAGKEKRTTGVKSINMKANSFKGTTSNERKLTTLVEGNLKIEVKEESNKYSGRSKNKTIKADYKTDVDLRVTNELEEILNAKKEEQETVQIELETTDVMWGMKKRKRKSEQELIEDYLRKHINRGIKEVQENMHKTHILCLIAHGRYVNSMLNSEEIMAAALPIVNNKKIYPEKRLSISHLEIIIKWFRKRIAIVDDPDTDSLLPLKQRLVKTFDAKKAHSKEEFTFMFLALLRVLGINCRLVFNLVPLSWKMSTNLLLKPKKCGDQPNDNKTSKKNNTSPNKASSSKKRSIQEAFSSDSDFSNEMKAKLAESKKPKAKISKSPKTKKLKEYLTYWIEVYSEEEEEWISLDISTGEIHHGSEQFEAKLLPQSGYMLAYNNDLTIKDVTKRYVHNWLSCKNKVRLDNEWWEKSISPFTGSFTKRDDEEDKILDQFLEKQPLPKTMSSYKNHSLYALQRYLLKFEALYPPDVSPVGFFKSEPVFPRECVRQLHGREKWIKEGKTVIVGEEPYKIVKARPKWDKAKCQIIKDLPLEIFGEWQVEDYEPPVAANGKVPRNEYGNVELFKPTMLPKGCVHINVPGINKLARKLGIDCASAITGFDFHGGWTHPVYEGYVICEEFQDILMDAWRQDQSEAAKRKEEKRLREIYGKWKKLIEGIRIKARMKEKYGHLIEKEAAERKEIKPKEKKPRKKVKQEEITVAPVSTREAHCLKIDFDTSAATAAQKQMVKMNSNLGDSSEEEATAEEKQKKIRSILSWNPGSSQNPDLSDSDNETGSSLQVSVAAPAIRMLKKNKLVEDLSEPSLSDGSTSNSEINFKIEPKQRLKRRRSRVTYKADSDSDAIFTDSGDDKPFKPE